MDAFPIKFHDFHKKCLGPAPGPSPGPAPGARPGPGPGPSPGLGGRAWVSGEGRRVGWSGSPQAYK